MIAETENFSKATNKPRYGTKTVDTTVVRIDILNTNFASGSFPSATLRYVLMYHSPIVTPKMTINNAKQA